MSLRFKFLIIYLVSIFALEAKDPPSDEAYEKETPLPILTKKEKISSHYIDYFEPEDKTQRERLSQYLAQVEENKYYLEIHWKNLLRYKKNLLSGYSSEIVTDSYFLSEKGSSDPRREMLATVRGLFFANSEQADLNPECIFPERYRWLRQTLKIEANVLRKNCTRFQSWKQSINLSKVKIVFASYFLQSPASMFGHTFLKLNQNIKPASELLDYGIGYAANPGDIDPFRYIVGGVFGGYTGKFSIFPYYIKVNEYNDLENRDLWEYELKFDESEKEILLGHLWEMGRAEFDYFFQKENCAYQILRLVEVIKDQDLDLRMRPTVTPLDLLKILKRKEIVIGDDPEYRSSLYQKIIDQLETLETEDREFFWERLSEINDKKNVQINDKTNPNLYPILIDTYLYRFPNLLNQNENYLELLKYQSKSPVPIDYTKTQSKVVSPDQAHGSYRVSLGYGNSSLGNYQEIEARIAYHDIMNVSIALPKASEIQFFNFKLRKYEERKAELTSMQLIKLTSLSPYNNLSKKPSYMIELGTQTLSLGSVENRKTVGNIDLLYGTSFAREFTKGFDWGHLSLLAGVKAHTNSEFRYGMRYGPQVMIHYLYDFGSWKFQWNYSFSYLAMSKNDNFFQNTVRLRYAINTDNEIRIEFTSYPLYSETQVAYHLLF